MLRRRQQQRQRRAGAVVVLMDDAHWERMAAEADSNANAEFGRFISGLTVQLHCSSVLEVGCNAGNDLMQFPDSVSVHGLDSNPRIAEVARRRLPAGADVRAGSVDAMPFADASIDMVFTHGFFNHLGDAQAVDAGVSEAFRVSAKYVTCCEVLGGGEGAPIDGAPTPCWGRNMYKRWLGYKVKIISNVQMHEDIDAARPQFVLVKRV